MRFVRALFSDLPLKLLSLVLAFVVWHVVRQGVVDTKELLFTVQPRVAVDVNLIANLTAPTNRRIRVEVNGPRQDVAELAARGGLVAVARIPEGTIGPDQDSVPIQFGVKDLLFPALDDLERVRAISMQPETVEVRVWGIETKTITLGTPEPEGGERPEHVKISVLSPPREVQIRGTKDRLAKLHELKPVIPADLLNQLIRSMADRTEADFRVHLELPGLDETLTVVGGDALDATVRIIARSTRNVWVPIHVHYEGPEPPVHFEPGPEEWWQPATDGRPARILLPFEGVPGRIAELDGDTVAAFVRAAELDENDRRTGVGNLAVHVSMQGVDEAVRAAVKPAYGEFRTLPVTVER